MSYKAGKAETLRMPDAPIESQYRCCVPDCPDQGVWSPRLQGSQWYCRFHAKVPEPKPRRQLRRDETIALMKQIFGRAAEFPDEKPSPVGGWARVGDFEAREERAAIQAEGNPL